MDVMLDPECTIVALTKGTCFNFVQNSSINDMTAIVIKYLKRGYRFKFSRIEVEAIQTYLDALKFGHGHVLVKC